MIKSFIYYSYRCFLEFNYRVNIRSICIPLNLLHKWIYSNLSSLDIYLCFCRGFVYCRNEELEPGWVVFSSGRLLHRPCSFDAKPYQLCQVVDPFTLQVLPSLDSLFYLGLT